MASLTGPVYVPAPTPVLPRYGLFKVANGPLPLPIHARIGGLQYQTATCDLPTCYEVLCASDVGRGTKTFAGGPTTIKPLPFIVYSSLTCTPVGLTDEDLAGYLKDRLVAGEQAIVENAFSLQSCGEFPGLSNNAGAVDPTGGTGAADIMQAFSILENWLYARYGLPGVLHVPAIFGAYLQNFYLVEKDSRGIWRTAMGTAVSIGNYAGNTLAGAAPAAGTSYVYITGATTIWATPDDALFVTKIPQVLNRGTNQLTAVMEREYVVSVDCFVAGVKTTISGLAH
jgi:hypothetical protein